MSLGILKYVGYALAALALVAAIVLGVVQCKKVDQQNRNVLVNAGTDKERSISQGEALNHVEKANNAVTNPTSNDLNVVCSKYDRNCTGKRSK